MKKIKVACVIPARNEELLVENTVRQTINYWSMKKGYDFVLVVVNDGSTDNTKKILTRLNKEYANELIVINRQSSGDKGGAVRSGILKSPKSDVLYFVDADMPFSLEDQFKVVSSVSKTQPVVYGSRVVSGKMDGNSQLRTFASHALIALNKSMLNINVTDTQCGLKAFKGDIVKPIFANNTVKGFGFDLYTTAYVEKHDVSIKTVPVSLLPEQRPSRVNVVKTSLQMLRDLITVRDSVRKASLDESLASYSDDRS